MPPHLDLRGFLATGRFFGLGKSSTRNDVYATLGPPDDVNMPRFDGEPPAICVFGGIELHFGHDPHRTLWLIHFDGPHLPPPGSSSLTVDPWLITAGTSLEQLRTVCEDAGIPLSRQDDGIVRWITLAGVALYFGDDDPDPEDCGLRAVSLNLTE